MIDVPDKSERRLALVIIDVQKKFSVSVPFEKQIENINKVTSMFREAKRPVIFVKYLGASHGHPDMGPEGDEYFDKIETHSSDITVYKKHMNSFRETELADVIKKSGCDNILIAGMITQYCVMSTYFAAFDNGLIPFLMEDACISNDEKMNAAAEQLCKTYNFEEVKENLEKVKI
mgnify:CR=1 FL=1